MVLDTPAVATQHWTGTTLSAAKDLRSRNHTRRPIDRCHLRLPTKAGQVVQAKVGISFLSVDQARQNVQQEIPGWNFAAVHAAATALWNTELAKLNLSGETDSQRRQLYTAMYHIMLMPTDRTGENPDLAIDRALL